MKAKENEIKIGDFVIWEYKPDAKEAATISSFDKVLEVNETDEKWKTYDIMPLLVTKGNIGETRYKFYVGRFNSTTLRKATPAEIKRYTEELVLKRL